MIATRTGMNTYKVYNCSKSLRVSFYLGSSVSEMETSLVATTSTLMPLLLKMSKTVAMKPTCPNIRVLTISSRVMPGLSTILVIKASFMSRSSDMRVPAAALHRHS